MGGSKNYWTEAEWNAYQWNPPGWVGQGGILHLLGEWEGPVLVKGPQSEGPIHNQFAYKPASAEAPDLPESMDPDNRPAGWGDTAVSFPAWCIFRRIDVAAETTRDPAASPKPTWQQVRRWALHAEIAEELHYFTGSRFEDEHLHRPVDRVALGAVDHLGTDAHIGEGFPRLSSLHFLHGHTGQAGEVLRRSVLRDHAETATLDVGSRAELEAVLKTAADNRDLAQSARNMVVVPIRRKIAEVQRYIDAAAVDGLTQEQSDAEFAKARATRAEVDKLLETIDADFNAAVATLRDEDWLPDDDLPRAKRILAERLEGVATGHMATIKHAESQNGVDLHAACDDEAIAHTEIAQEKKVGQIRIERAADLDKAKAAFAKAKIAIEAVKARRTPLFYKKQTDGTFDRIHGDTVTYAEVTVEIRAMHPSWRESRFAIPGEVSLFGSVGLNEDGTIDTGIGMLFTAPETPSERGEMDGKLVVPAGKRGVFNLTGRSVCGPSQLTVILEPPAETAE